MDSVLRALIEGTRSQDLVLVSQPNPCTCACLVQADLASWGRGEMLFTAGSWATLLGKRCF